MVNFTMKHMDCASRSGNALPTAKTPVYATVLDTDRVFSGSCGVCILHFNSPTASSDNFKVKINDRL